MPLIENPIPEYVFKLRRGDGDKFTITVTQGGTPVNLTGKLWYTAKRNLSDTDAKAIVKKSSPSSGITIVNAGAGIAELEILGTDTEVLEDKIVQLFHDCQYQVAGGQPHTIFKGLLIVDPDVTRSKL